MKESLDKHGTHQPCHGGKYLPELLHVLDRINPVPSPRTYVH